MLSFTEYYLNFKDFVVYYLILSFYFTFLLQKHNHKVQNYHHRHFQNFKIVLNYFKFNIDYFHYVIKVVFVNLVSFTRHFKIQYYLDLITFNFTNFIC